MMIVIVQVPDPAKDPDSRQKMIRSAALLLREQGFTGTSFGDVLARSGAPRGSIYHHFPGGKNEMIEEAVSFAGGYTDKVMKDAAQRVSPDRLVAGFIDVVRKTLEENDYRAGCPVAAVAVETHAKAPQLEKAAAEAFGSWARTLTDALVDAGADPDRAARLATMTVTSVEGAIIVCRASHDTTALEQIQQELVALYRGALPDPALPDQ